MRDVFLLTVNGATLMGSAHWPLGRASERPPGAAALPAPSGVLILNTGYDPRSAPGDFSVHLGDHLASLGYPVFRLDMPGLGDSPGEIAADATDYERFFKEGGFAAYVRAAADELSSRFAIHRLVLLGNCAGAVTSIYAAAQNPKASVHGLVLLEPAFSLARPRPATGNQPGLGVRLSATLRARYQALRLQVHNWLLERAWGEKISANYNRGLSWLRRRAGSTLPQGANLPLIRHWERIMAGRLPVLVFTASIPKRGAPQFDYLAYLLSKSGGLAVRHDVEGATHTLADSKSKEFVVRHIVDWLNANFPLPTCGARC